MAKKVLHSCLVFLSFLSLCLSAQEVIPIPIGIGVLLHLNSSIGTMAQTCIRLALYDFYNHNNASYATTLSLHIRDTHNDIVTAASAALDLIDNQNVHAIIGPQNSGEARFVAEIGTKAQIPIISFSATSPSLSPSQTPYFVRTTQSDLSQVEAICAIAQAYGWHKIILISENTEYGNGLIPYLAAALGEINIQVPYKTAIDPHSHEAEISKEVKKLKGMQTKVFLVHMSADVGSNFFRLVNSAGMMREGYAWMVTQEMSAKMNPMGPKVMGYMQGVLGVRPMVKKTKGLEDLNRRWKGMANAYNKSSVLSLFGIWAYDTVQALALAVDKVGIANSTFQKSNMTNKSRDKYVMGPRLLNTILDTKLKGLSGNFNLVEGQLEPSVLEVFNVIGRKERIIGYWSSQMGLFRDLDEDGVPMAKGKLKQPIWPGDTIEPPTVLRIGVPVRQSFTEFVKVERESPNGTSKISGFSIDVFFEAIKVLPFSFRYEFVPLTNKNGTTAGNYDEILCQIKEKKLDVIIGDITIQWNRTRCVDFTTSYLESSVWMVVSFKSGNTTWTLFRPFHWSLWLFILEIFPIVTVVIYILEFESVKSSVDQINNIIRFPFTIYTHSERLVSNWSRCLAITSFGVFVIILQVYTANLTSILSEERAMVASVSNVKEIKSKDYNVGYQRGSWVKGFLIEELGLKESQLKGYGTPEEYSKALSLGSKKGGVDAIFDETPYLFLFLSNYGHDKYTMAGPPYQTHGFGFAFPKKSGLVSYLSSAILKVGEDIDVFEGIKGKYSINTNIPSQYPKHARSLTLQDFIVFFLVIMVFAEVAFGAILWGYIKFRFFRGEYSPSQPPGTTLDTTASEDHHTCLSPHHDDTFDDDIYHSDYY